MNPRIECKAFFTAMLILLCCAATPCYLYGASSKIPKNQTSPLKRAKVQPTTSNAKPATKHAVLKPDLYISQLTASPRTVVDGDTLTLSAKIKNSSKKTLQNVRVRFTNMRSRKVLGEKVFAIGAARTKECHIEIPITQNKRVTILTFKAVVDPFNRIAESNEKNNERTTQVRQTVKKTSPQQVREKTAKTLPPKKSQWSPPAKTGIKAVVQPMNQPFYGSIHPGSNVKVVISGYHLYPADLLTIHNVSLYKNKTPVRTSYAPHHRWPELEDFGATELLFQIPDNAPLSDHYKLLLQIILDDQGRKKNFWVWSQPFGVQKKTVLKKEGLVPAVLDKSHNHGIRIISPGLNETTYKEGDTLFVQYVLDPSGMIGEPPRSFDIYLVLRENNRMTSQKTMLAQNVTSMEQRATLPEGLIGMGSSSLKFYQIWVEGHGAPQWAGISQVITIARKMTYSGDSMHVREPEEVLGASEESEQTSPRFPVHVVVEDPPISLEAARYKNVRVSRYHFIYRSLDPDEALRISMVQIYNYRQRRQMRVAMDQSAWPVLDKDARETQFRFPVPAGLSPQDDYYLVVRFTAGSRGHEQHWWGDSRPFFVQAAPAPRMTGVTMEGRASQFRHGIRILSPGFNQGDFEITNVGPNDMMRVRFEIDPRGMIGDPPESFDIYLVNQTTYQIIGTLAQGISSFDYPVELSWRNVPPNLANDDRDLICRIMVRGHDNRAWAGFSPMVRINNVNRGTLRTRTE